LRRCVLMAGEKNQAVVSVTTYLAKCHIPQIGSGKEGKNG